MLRQVQMIVGSVMGSLVILAIALSTAFPDGRFAAPPLWLLGAQVAAAVAIHLLVEAVGYRTAALHVETPESEARLASGRAFQAGCIVRASLCEAIALGSLATAFLLDDGGYAGLLTGTGISLALMAAHAWPRPAGIDRTAAALEREGARSYLREHLGLAAPGPIQEL